MPGSWRQSRLAACSRPSSAVFWARTWSTPKIEELRITPDRCLLARVEGEASFKAFLGAEADLIRNIHGLSAVAELDGDEIGYLLGKVAELKRIE